MSKCEVCGEGQLSTILVDTDFSYAGRSGCVQLRLKRCNVCCSELTDQEDSNHNRRAVNAFKKAVDNIPSGRRIRQLRRDLKLTQSDAGAIFGGGPVAFSKYEADDVIPDAAMANLLRLAIDNPELVKRMEYLRNGGLIFSSGVYSDMSTQEAKGYISTQQAEEDDGDLFLDGIRLCLSSKLDDASINHWVINHG